MAKIIEEGEYPFVELGNSIKLKRDQWCVAIGHANGFNLFRTPPIRLGRILDVDFGGYVATDCALMGGDSGGPLFDLDGKLIAIHSNIGAHLSENHHVPIDVYKRYWDRMLEGERWGRLTGIRREDPNKPYLGVEVHPRQPEEGVKIHVQPDTAAERAGLRDGDIIKSINGTVADSWSTVVKSVSNKKVGERVDMIVARDERELKISARLTSSADTSAEGARPVRRQVRVSPDKRQELLAELLKRNNGQLKVSSDTLEKFGGIDAFVEEVQEYAAKRGLTPEQFEELQQSFATADDFYEDVTRAFRSSITPASRSVVRLFEGERQVALGTIVTSDGYLLTKASQIRGKKITARTARDRKFAVKSERVFPKWDLALAKLDADGRSFVPVKWFSPQEESPLGTFLAAAGPERHPLAIGVVSVAMRSLSQHENGYLGVALDERDVNSIRLKGILPDGSADQAGLEPRGRCHRTEWQARWRHARIHQISIFPEAG